MEGSSPPVRRYDTSAINDLLDRTLHYLGTGEQDMLEVAYLVDALRHYHDRQVRLYKEWESLRDMGFAVQRAARDILNAIDESTL